MGIGPKINPRLIETHLTGYGFTGPYSKRPGIDPLAQAYMGMSRAQGGPENRREQDKGSGGEAQEFSTRRLRREERAVEPASVRQGGRQNDLPAPQ